MSHEEHSKNQIYEKMFYKKELILSNAHIENFSLKDYKEKFKICGKILLNKVYIDNTVFVNKETPLYFDNLNIPSNGEFTIKNSTIYGKKISFFNSELMGRFLLFDVNSTVKYIEFDSCNFGENFFKIKKSDFRQATINLKKLNLTNSFVSFKDSKINELFFEGSHLHKRTTCNGAIINYLNLSKSYVYDNFSLKNAEIVRLNIYDASIDGSFNCDWNSNRIKNKILNILKEKKRILFFNKSYYKNHLKISEEFRILKENFNRLGQYEDEDAAYVEYKKHLAISDLHDNNKIKGGCSYFFYLFGKYGTNPFSILRGIVILILIFSFCHYYLIDFTPLTKEGHNLFEFTKKYPNSFKLYLSVYFSAITFFTIGYGDLSPTSAGSMISSCIEGFLGVASMSYLTVAIIRKVLR